MILILIVHQIKQVLFQLPGSVDLKDISSLLFQPHSLHVVYTEKTNK